MLDRQNRIIEWFKLAAGTIVFIAGLFILLIYNIFYGYFRQKYIEKKQQKEFLKVFGDWKNSMPTLDFGSSYGWATFKITFQNKNDLDFATKNKLTEDFKNCIKSYYSSKFDADVAVNFTYLESNS
jgi:hypothetical protein